LHHAEIFRRLVKTSQLTEEDIIALELKYNDPKVSFFIMNGFTPHFEWTPPGQGAASVFYVSEPHDLDINHIDLGDYQLKIIT
jgi:hypothetical protein